MQKRLIIQQNGKEYKELRNEINGIGNMEIRYIEKTQYVQLYITNYTRNKNMRPGRECEL